MRKATRCSSEVWASIKKINRTTSAKSNNSINVETWFNHFKELLTCEPDIDFNFKQMVNNYNDAHASECPTCINNEPDELNKSIEISEITDVIKHLQDGQQPGIAGLNFSKIVTITLQRIFIIFSMLYWIQVYTLVSGLRQ